MPLEVDYITLGDASERLSTPDNRVPAPTLRHWTDQMEEFNVHYVQRNNRNERIYEESDIKVFEYLRDLKEEYGRRTTTKDIGFMISEKGRAGELKLRTKEDSPRTQQPTNRQADLLNQEDIKQLMQSERVRQFIGVIVSETQKNMRDELIEEVRQTVREELLQEKTQAQIVLEELEEKRAKREEEREKRQIERDARIEENLKKRDDQMNEWLAKMREEQKAKEEVTSANENKSFWQRLFGQ